MQEQETRIEATVAVCPSFSVVLALRSLLFRRSNVCPLVQMISSFFFFDSFLRFYRSLLMRKPPCCVPLREAVDTRKRQLCGPETERGRGRDVYTCVLPVSCYAVTRRPASFLLPPECEPLTDRAESVMPWQSSLPLRSRLAFLLS